MISPSRILWAGGGAGPKTEKSGVGKYQGRAKVHAFSIFCPSSFFIISHIFVFFSLRGFPIHFPISLPFAFFLPMSSIYDFSLPKVFICCLFLFLLICLFQMLSAFIVLPPTNTRIFRFRFDLGDASVPFSRSGRNIF